MTLKEKLQNLKTTSRSLSTPEEMLTSQDSDVCPICHGDEWVLEIIGGKEVATPCICRAKAIQKRRMAFAELPDGLSDIRLASFSISVYTNEESRQKARIACQIVKEYLNMFEDAKRNGMGLYICSETKGSGKTRMAASIANELMEKHNTQVKFSTSMRILTEIRRSYEPGTVMTESQLLSALSTAEVLIIDDFGTERVTDWVKDKFYEIINSRYVDKKATIFTSNEPIEGLKYEDRITNRIKEMCYQVNFPEESIRDHIADKNMNNMMKRIKDGLNG